MARNGGPESAALVVILYFNRNPEEELTSQDLTTKFGIPPNLIWRKLMQSVRDEMLAYDSAGAGRGRSGTWRAGQRLLAMSGHFRQEVSQGNVPASQGNVPLPDHVTPAATL